MTEETETPRPADVAGRLDGLVSCPNCPDQGWYVVQGTTSGCCNRPTETGECCGCPIPVETQEQEQCEFCWTVPNSVFNAETNKAANAAYLARHRTHAAP